MNTNRQHTLPKLRFPEFRNTSEWELNEINDLLDYEQPGKYQVKNSNYQSTGTPVLTANKSFILGHTNEKEGIYHRVPVIIFDDFTTDMKYVTFPFKIKSAAIKILTPSDDNDLRFLYELMSLIRFDATQHKRYFISKYRYLKIPTPSKSEQQKIASCLASLDDLIAAQEQKINLLKQHKQGLLQQLFPQDGKTIPKLRFPEFRDDEQWRLRKLEDIIDRNTEKFDAQKNHNLMCLIELENIESKTGRILSVSEITKTKNTYSKFEAGDILFGKLRPYLQKYASPDFDGVCSSEILVLRGKEILNGFLFYLVQTERFIEMANVSSGSRMPRTEWDFLKRSEFNIPSREEQLVIVKCLKSLDSIIDAELSKLETLTLHKRGLMQQLFPHLHPK